MKTPVNQFILLLIYVVLLLLGQLLDSLISYSNRYILSLYNWFFFLPVFAYLLFGTINNLRFLNANQGNKITTIMCSIPILGHLGYFVLKLI